MSQVSPGVRGGYHYTVTQVVHSEAVSVRALEASAGCLLSQHRVWVNSVPASADRGSRSLRRGGRWGAPRKYKWHARTRCTHTLFWITILNENPCSNLDHCACATWIQWFFAASKESESFRCTVQACDVWSTKYIYNISTTVYWKYYVSSICRYRISIQHI